MFNQRLMMMMMMMMMMILGLALHPIYTLLFSSQHVAEHYLAPQDHLLLLDILRFTRTT